TFTASKEIDKVTGEVLSTIKTYQALGYKLVSDDTKGAEIVFDNEDGKDQSYIFFFIDVVVIYDADAQKAKVAY
ncbi:mucin-binding protein, partial [Lactobacillus delbrueckii]|uniref:mucin-binding protein n=1 Tax=Lactobacillus delbrueckii TaxID=1584 RepID=UPI001F488100